jgi:hypothetical protein
MSSLVRNVPILPSIEMSPSERETEDACGSSWKPFCGFQGAVGAFWASTAPAASIGSSSVHQLPVRHIAPHLFESLSPGMIGGRVGAPRRGRRRYRPRRRCERATRARGNFLPRHDPIAIPDLQVTVSGLAHVHGAARRGIQSGLHPRNTAALLRHVPTRARLAPRRLTTRLRSLKLQ